VPVDVARLVDFTFWITHDNRNYHVIGEFKAHGFPQQLTLAINQLLRYRHKAGRVNDELMVAAPYISPEGAQLCRDDNVSYFDSPAIAASQWTPLHRAHRHFRIPSRKTSWRRRASMACAANGSFAHCDRTEKGMEGSPAAQQNRRQRRHGFDRP